MKPLLFHAAVAALYSPFTIYTELPFDYSSVNDAVPFTEDVRTAVQVRGGGTSWTYHPIIDTGTCGLVVSASGLPGWNASYAAKYPVGWHFLSSSKRLYSGHWIPTDVYFTNSPVEVVATIPILAVEAVTVCPNYNITIGDSTCPSPTTGTAPVVTPMPTHIQLMGVGFGREHDGQPQGTPDKNPFLNIRSINGTSPQQNALFRNGYIINKRGITVGLTSSNTAGMDFAKLSARANRTDSRDWSPVECCMAVDGAACTPGAALIDTGVSQMYMTLPSETVVHRKNPPLLDNGSTVDIQIGSTSNPVALEMFTVGDAAGINNSIVPSTVRLTLANPSKNPPHVNTGRHFLRAWTMAFDADGGFLGFGAV